MLDPWLGGYGERYPSCIPWNLGKIHVLDMSKIEAGRITLHENSVDLHRLLNSLEEMLELKASSKGLRLIFDCASDVPQNVRTDERKLRQILINLLSNAIKFTQEGIITLRVRTMAKEGAGGREKSAETHPSPSPPPQVLCFEVEDTGVGIAPEDIETLFDAFVQLKTAQTSQEGTGLGLSISRRFIQLMGGDIGVDSALGVGTTFSFYIQTFGIETAAAQTQQSTRRVLHLAPNQPSYRILVVDDSPENCQLMVKLLDPLGFEVRTAMNGREAIDLWRTWKPHLIWMDMRMPVMDGYEATKQIKSTSQGKDTVIVALSASAFEQERASVLAAGCDDFVRKPFQEGFLFNKMTEHLGVRYVYVEENQGSGRAAKPEGHRLELTEFTPDLAAMPAEWVKQLHWAAVEGDEQLILQLLKRIPAEHTSLIIPLTNLATNFRFDKIINFVQQIQA